MPSITEALDKLDAELKGHMQAEERMKRDREEKEKQRREVEERQRQESEIRREQQQQEERRKELEKAEEEERKRRERDKRAEEEEQRRRQEQDRKRMQEEEKRREVEWLEKKKREWERQEAERRQKEAERQAAEEEEEKKMEEQRQQREQLRKEEEERRRKEHEKEKEARVAKGSPPPLSDPRPPGLQASPPYPWRWAEGSRPPPLTPQTEHAREKQRQREMAANQGGATCGLHERDANRRPPPAVALGELPKLYRAFPREAPPLPPPAYGSGAREGLPPPQADDEEAQFEEEPSALLPNDLADIMAMLDESIKKEEEELRNGERAGPIDRYPPAPDLTPATRTALGRDDPGCNPRASPPVLSRQGSSASPRSRASSPEDAEEPEYRAYVRRSVGNTDYRHSDLAKLYGLPERNKSEAEEDYDDDDSETPSCSPSPQRPHLHQTGLSGAFKPLAALLESQKYAYRGGPFGRPPPSALVGVKYSSSLSLGPDARRQTEPAGPAATPESEAAAEDELAGQKDDAPEDVSGLEDEPSPPSSGTVKQRKEKDGNEAKNRSDRSEKREKREAAPGSSCGGSSRDRKRRKEGKSRKEKDRRILGDLNLQSKERADKSQRKKKREAPLGLAVDSKSDFPPKELKIRLIKVESGDGETFIASEVEEKRIPLENIGIQNTASEIIRSCK